MHCLSMGDDTTCGCLCAFRACFPACRDGATPLLLPYSAEDHATIAAAAAAAAASSSADSSRSSSSKGTGRAWLSSSRRKQQEEQQRQRELQEQQRRQQQQHLQRQVLQQKQQELYAAAVTVEPSELRLMQANHFMPPDSVLELSEFGLPRDSETLDFYNWLLS